jgi:Cytochrome C'
VIHFKPALVLGLLVVTSCKGVASSAPAGAPRVFSDSPPARPLLDEMDPRIAVPLLPIMAHHQKQNMRDHLLAVQEIVLAAGREDFSGVEKAASRVGFSPQMGQMCAHMGAAARGFTEQAVAFHHTADSIGVAARRHDRVAVMTALGKTLQACTGCHETYRQQVVDEATWTQLTSESASSRSHSGG